RTEPGRKAAGPRRWRLHPHGVGRDRPLPGGEVPGERLAPRRASSTGGGLPVAALHRDRAGTAALANHATHRALPAREAARGGDTDRPSGVPRHGGWHGSAHGRPAAPRRRRPYGGIPRSALSVAL